MSRTSRSIPRTRSKPAASQPPSRARARSESPPCPSRQPGNAGNAMAAYAARAGLEAKVFLPRDVKTPFIRECELYGADVTLVDGVITDAARAAAEAGASLGWYDVSTLKEPYRIEGKKTMAYELAEQMEWEWPDWIVYPTGGGTGMVGMWKAFEEIERIGWVSPGRRPRMVSVQADGCAPIVRAFERGTENAAPWENPATVADGLRVPRAIGDFLILRAVRESRGTALRCPRRSDDRWHARPRRHGRDQRRAGRRSGARRDSTAGGRRLDSLARPRRPVQYGRGAEILRRAAVLTRAILARASENTAPRR